MNQDIDFLKKKQRKQQSIKRSSIDSSVILNNSFYEKLTEYEWFNQSKIIASFLSIKTEIPTHYFNQYLLSLGKILCLPIIQDNEETLVFKKYSKGDNLKPALVYKFNNRPIKVRVLANSINRDIKNDLVTVDLLWPDFIQIMLELFQEDIQLHEQNHQV